jgi:MoaA/NifB/PqqE/SkfB family radical SAM enzyme
MGGLSHLHIDSLGNVNPCALLPVTFGNILEEDFTAIYERMRKAIPHPLHKECPSITLGKVLEARSDGGRLSPVPFESVSQEWQALFS